eukprot:TRINITY_DN12289_c1_g3_i10.p1 TRINITY_DN12289_c1_g3~~TRINITY_DN12289_c1_g3_i10.p1  ORF type:complete len:535 (+),score=98.49 TRINITY_DN12289_c1_g3_i10:2589-4193(+)
MADSKDLETNWNDLAPQANTMSIEMPNSEPMVLNDDASQQMELASVDFNAILGFSDNNMANDALPPRKNTSSRPDRGATLDKPEAHASAKLREIASSCTSDLTSSHSGTNDEDGSSDSNSTSNSSSEGTQSTSTTSSKEDAVIDKRKRKSKSRSAKKAGTLPSPSDDTFSDTNAGAPNAKRSYQPKSLSTQSARATKSEDQSKTNSSDSDGSFSPMEIDSTVTTSAEGLLSELSDATPKPSEIVKLTKELQERQLELNDLSQQCDKHKGEKAHEVKRQRNRVASAVSRIRKKLFMVRLHNELARLVKQQKISQRQIVKQEKTIDRLASENRELRQMLSVLQARPDIPTSFPPPLSQATAPPGIPPPQQAGQPTTWAAPIQQWQPQWGMPGPGPGGPPGAPMAVQGPGEMDSTVNQIMQHRMLQYRLEQAQQQLAFVAANVQSQGRSLQQHQQMQQQQQAYQAQAIAQSQHEQEQKLLQQRQNFLSSLAMAPSSIASQVPSSQSLADLMSVSGSGPAANPKVQASMSEDPPASSA